MSKPTNWACWAWKEDGVVRYVGTGPFGKAHPALAQWLGRFEGDSELNLWLQGFLEEPERVVCGKTIMTKKMARDLAAIYRARHASTLLSARDHAGGGKSRGVCYCPGDDWDAIQVFASVREAARAFGINASTVTRRCNSKNSPDWLFLVDE